MRTVSNIPRHFLKFQDIKHKRILSAWTYTVSFTCSLLGLRSTLSSIMMAQYSYYGSRNLKKTHFRKLSNPARLPECRRKLRDKGVQPELRPSSSQPANYKMYSGVTRN